MLCPKCDGEMVAKIGTHGQFWSCRLYPDCDGSADMVAKADEPAKAVVHDNDADFNAAVTIAAALCSNPNRMVVGWTNFQVATVAVAIVCYIREKV